MKKVSVIIPVYNAESTIEKCLKSIIQQSYTNLEIIVINDGSTDSSLKILTHFASSDPRIIIIDKDNEGASAARNSGLKAATGDYVQFVDSDDYLHINMISSLVENIISNSSDISICGYIECSNNNIVEHRGIDYLGKVDNILDYLFDNILLFSLWNKLYIREKINHYFINNIALGEDILFNLDYLKNCNRISVIPSPLYFYVLSNTSGLHIQYHETDHETDKMIYAKLNELIEDDTNIKERIFIDSTQRTIQRMIFSSQMDIKHIKEKIRKILNENEVIESLNKVHFNDKQHRIFRYLFKSKNISLIIFLFKIKQIILKIIKN